MPKENALFKALPNLQTKKENALFKALPNLQTKTVEIKP
jgi:hypothetical protein